MSNEVTVTRLKEHVSNRRVVPEEFHLDKSMNNSLPNGIEMSDVADQSVENRKHCHSDAIELTETGELTSEKRKKKKQKNSAENRWNNGKQKVNDKYCWICHKCGQIVSCSSCCRSYHLACLNASSSGIPSGWVCSECKNLSVTDNTVVYSPKWRNITKDQLVRMLLFLTDRLSMQNWAMHFREPLDESTASGYYTMVVHSVNLREMRSDILAGRYTSVHSFVTEFQWIIHNCIIFNGLNSPVVAQARLLDTGCSREIAFMRACPLCYQARIPALTLLPSTSKVLPLLTDSVPPANVSSQSHSSASPAGGVSSAEPGHLHTARVTGAGGALNTDPSDGDFDPWWFCFVCDVAHPIVWVRLKHYPRWPAKVISMINDTTLLVSFFGDYDLTTAPIGSVTLHTEARHANLSCSQAPVAIAAPTLDPIGSPLSSSEHSSTHTGTPPPISPGSPNSSLSTVSGNRSRRANSEKLIQFYPNYRQAILELDRYVAGLRERWPHFVLPASKFTDFNKRNVDKYYGSHLYEQLDVTKANSSSLLPPSVGQSTASGVAAAPSPFSSTSSSLQRATPVRQDTSLCKPSDSGRSIAQSTVIQPVTSSVPRKPDNNNNCDLSSRPLSIHTPLSDQGVLARVAATLRDVRHLCPMPVAPADPLPEPEPPAIRPSEDSAKTVAATVSATPLQVPTLKALEPVGCQADNTETTRQVIDRYRMQLNEMLVKLADSLSAQDMPDIVSTSCSTDTELKMVDAEVQTSVGDSEPPLLPVKRPSPSPHQSETDFRPPVKRPKMMSVKTNTDPTEDRTGAASNLQVSMMEEEIERLDDEVNRLNVLLNLTRLEMGAETRRRMAELRRVWAAEVTAVLDAAIRIWEQDVVKLVDNVKRKQWCAYCGRVAYYYCCWNTCYCDSVCQSKHWAVHITSCVQARSHQQQQQPPVNAATSVAPQPIGATQAVATLNAVAPTTSIFNNSIAGVPASSGLLLMPGAQTTTPVMVRPVATATSAGGTGLPVGMPSQSQAVGTAATTVGVDQHARYHQQHPLVTQHQQQQQTNRLLHNLPTGVGGSGSLPATALPLHNVPRHMDLSHQLGGLVK